MVIRSPFPGMDPWLEQHWGDVHHALITYTRDALNEQLPEGMRARMEERVYVEPAVERVRRPVPDVRVIEYLPDAKRRPRTAGGVTVAEPLVISVPIDPITETFVEIIDARSGNRVVTVIEILSPSNKVSGTGRDLYLKKQGEVLASDASLVEIDLVREGDRMLACRPEFVPPSHRTVYQVCVSRGWQHDQREVIAIPLREPLPRIGVPLRESDPDAVLDLQALIERAYANGGYDVLDYSGNPVPPLSPDDAAWADALLKAAGRR